MTKNSSGGLLIGKPKFIVSKRAQTTYKLIETHPKWGAVKTAKEALEKVRSKRVALLKTKDKKAEKFIHPNLGVFYPNGPNNEDIHLQEEIPSKIEQPPLIRHNWLYSVVPDFPIEDNFGGFIGGGIFLVGYCKQCNNYFTARLNLDGVPNFVAIEKLDIPKWGCQPVE